MKKKKQTAQQSTPLFLEEALHQLFVTNALKQSRDCLEREHACRPSAKNEYKRRKRFLRRKQTVSKLKVMVMFPWLLVRGVIPNFLKGEVNLWTNIEAILFRDEFRPLRHAFWTWFLFTFFVIIFVRYFFT